MGLLARDTSLRLLAAMLTVALLAVAGIWFWKAGHSERHIPEGAYLVQAQPAPAASLSHTAVLLGGD